MTISDLSSVTLLHLLSGNLEVPGAPVLHLALSYDNQSGAISGQALITQAIAPPDGRLLIRNVSGQVHGLGVGGATRVMSLKGEYVHILPPPAIGSVTEKFECTYVTDNEWKGHGSFEYGGRSVRNVPIKQRG